MIVNCEHSALYFATQGHSMMNLRNALPVWWRYELCEETEALQCMLQCDKTKHNITKCFVFKSSIVCNMVKYVLEIIVMWFQLFIWRLLVYQMRPVVNKFCFVSCDVIWYKIKLSRFKMARNVEKPWTSLQIWCYAWSHEGMSQHFHIWRDKQTIQGPWPNCVWRDKQNQRKDPVFESKTRKPNCILLKNFSLDFIQTYTSRSVAFLCIFLYMKSLLWRRQTKCHSSIPSCHSQSLLDCKTATR